MTQLWENYKKACNDYLQAFCQKHDFDFNSVDTGWVVDKPGTIIVIGDYFVSMEDIIVDIEQNVPEEKFLEYYDWSLNDGCNWNYETWLRGGPIPLEYYDMDVKINEFKRYLDNYKKDDCPFLS